MEVAAIAAGVGPVGLEERARALLDSLRRVVPFQAGWLGLLDPEHRVHVPLVVQGYEDRFSPSSPGLHHRLGDRR